MSITGTAPEQGQLVRLRNRYFIVEDVIPHDTSPTVSPITRVSLECIDDDRLGESVDVIWIQANSLDRCDSETDSSTLSVFNPCVGILV